MLWGDEEAFGEFFCDLGNAIEGVGKNLDVLAFKRGDKRFAEVFGEFPGDAFVVAAGFGEPFHRPFVFRIVDEFYEAADAGTRLFGAAFHEGEEAVILAEELLKGKHSGGFVTQLLQKCTKNF
jgi:hypothetical protein